jgi:hypothetical protein
MRQVEIYVQGDDEALYVNMPEHEGSDIDVINKILEARGFQKSTNLERDVTIRIRHHYHHGTIEPQNSL